MKKEEVIIYMPENIDLYYEVFSDLEKREKENPDLEITFMRLINYEYLYCYDTYHLFEDFKKQNRVF